MSKLVTSIGQSLISGYVLYSCDKEWQTGYKLMKDGKDAFLTRWSPGSFYPLLNNLYKKKMLNKRKTKSNRITYEYKTTNEGKKYLKNISNYFKNEIITDYITYLMR